MQLSSIRRPTPEISTLSLHDALPTSACRGRGRGSCAACSAIPTASARRTSPPSPGGTSPVTAAGATRTRSEEHTSELQSLRQLVCRLLLEKTKHQTVASYFQYCSSIA